MNSSLPKWCVIPLAPSAAKESGPIASIRMMSLKLKHSLGKAWQKRISRHVKTLRSSPRGAHAGGADQSSARTALAEASRSVPPRAGLCSRLFL